jgi:probable F420-dependent oxidoreductase
MPSQGSPAFAISLPYRSSVNLDPGMIQQVAIDAENAGFNGLWVSERTVGTVFSLDPLVALSYAAAVSSKIRLGVAVVVSPVHDPVRLAHQYSSLDYISGGRVTLGVGIGRDGHYEDFRIPMERRVTRFLEGIQTMKALWSEDSVTFPGEIIQVRGISIRPRPIQSPNLPIWFGGSHDNSLKRAARHADGWIGAGLQPSAAFVDATRRLRRYLSDADRDPGRFTVSKRVYTATSRSEQTAHEAMGRWFTEVLRRPEMTHCGLSGTVEQVRAQLQPILEAHPDHLVLHPVSWTPTTVEDMRAIAGD